MSTLLSEFAWFAIAWWLALYAILVGLYCSLGWLVSYYNQRYLSTLRIQDRTCSPDLILRDKWQSIGSLGFIAAMFACGLALRQLGLGVTPLPASAGPFILWALISMLLFDTWFYWLHRLVHHRALYRRVHQWHHRTTTPTVWANNSDTWLDNLLLQSYWLWAPVLLPAPTLVLVVHKIYDQVTGMLGHAGYEYAASQLSHSPSPMVGSSFHDQHHQYFNYNFATHFSIWDRLMGTLYPEYDDRIKQFMRAKSSKEPSEF